MPSWTLIAVPAHEEQISASVRTTFSDPEIGTRHAYARSVRTFIDVEHLDTNARLDLYRYGGASMDQLRQLDVSPVLSITAGPIVRAALWDEPLPPCARIRVDFVNLSPGSSVTAAYRVFNSYLAY